MSNKLTRTALELLMIEQDLPCRFDYSKFDYNIHNIISVDDFEIYLFEQTWGSTALGFGGVGGQAITSAMTYILIPINVDQNCFVYFAGRFAYSVPYSQVFLEDVRKQNMAPVYEKGKYMKENN